ncbi:lysozyme family protein [Corynebacterium terpenotabidum]|uniref:Transglycosylase SLT domain-containing protein n=1 Tax=Corynebacterium terpenotabidum Y-11 TaxID=1200352 RepID=S4XHU4_9CORY|nr:hypothetical protein A606_08050 [Corynebacterium terpenotabidum Y-11]
MRTSAGVTGLLCALLLVIVVVGGLVVGVGDRDDDRIDIPEDVPPADAGDVADVAGTASSLDISEDFLVAYLAGAESAATEYPDCHLAWNTLAGIGYVESRHGSYGVRNGRITGPALDGSGGFMEIPDTDDGRLDGDREYDRAVGPMQFLPDSWRMLGDGGDPQDITDAAPAAARLLCAGGRDLATPEGWSEAVLAYNRSGEYLTTVRDAAANYAVGQPAA